MANIKKINIDGTTYDIEAVSFGGRSSADWENMIHGVVDTYVIQTAKSSASGYAGIVNSASATVTTTKAVLDTLVNNKPSGTGTDTYKVGDIILMEATSDGTKVFDRWISSVDASGNISLAVLETQVATHYHEITPSISKALTSATATYNTEGIAKVGSDKTVVTGVSGTPVVVTSVTGGGSVTHDLTLASTSSGGLGHSHTVNSHSHSVTLGDTALVSTRANAYTSLTSVNTTLHGHNDNVTVAGSTTGATSSKVITGGGTTAVMTSLKDETNTTSSNTAGLTTANNTTGTTTGTNTAGVTAKANTTALSTKGTALTTDANTAALATNSNTTAVSTKGTSLTTKSNTAALATSVQVSSNTTGTTNTADAGSHTHSVSATTTENVIKTVTVATKVLTGGTFSAGTLPTVQGTVVKSVGSVSKTVMTGATLNNNAFTFTSHSVSGEVLYFASKSQTVGITPTTTTISAISSLSTGTQSEGSLPTLSFTSATQSFTSGKVTATCTTGSGGTHSHGFAHTHTIEAHTHGIDSHSHTIEAHTHGIASHTHGIASHLHTIDSHTHGIDGHTHSVSAHNHTIASHTHTYAKSVKNGTANAYTSLTSVNTTLHAHNADVTTAGGMKDNSTSKVITGGGTTSVIAKLKADAAYATDSKTPVTDTKYYKLTGSITHPGYTITTASLSNLIATGTVKQAAAATTSVVKSITTASASFVSNVTKTGVNKGGSPA